MEFNPGDVGLPGTWSRTLPHTDLPICHQFRSDPSQNRYVRHMKTPGSSWIGARNSVKAMKIHYSANYSLIYLIPILSETSSILLHSIFLLHRTDQTLV